MAENDIHYNDRQTIDSDEIGFIGKNTPKFYHCTDLNVLRQLVHYHGLRRYFLILTKFD